LYVREWLGAVVCGGVVEYDPVAQTYRLPPEHALLLTGQTSRNLTTIATLFPLLGRVVPAVVEAFREGGGVPYAAYQPEFTGVMDARSRPRYQELLFTKYLALPDGVLPRLESGSRAAHVGAGTGLCVTLMAQRFPRSTFVGYDFSEAAVARARQEAAAMGLTNASFVVQDVAGLPSAPPFDLITAFDAIHDQVDPAAVLRGIRQALAPGGVFLMVDIHASSRLEENVGKPMTAFVYTVSTLHCMTVSLAHGGAGPPLGLGAEPGAPTPRGAGLPRRRALRRGGA